MVKSYDKNHNSNPPIEEFYDEEELEWYYLL
jgi:hypothetical protein